MDNELIPAKESPRIEDDILYWYFGNTFNLIFELDLTDKDTGLPIIFKPEDKVCISFYNEEQRLVKAFEFTNIPANNCVELNFDIVTSRKFVVGKYTYCIDFNGRMITTLAAVKEVEVEECH